MKRSALLVALLAVLACGSTIGRIPEPPGGAVAVSGEIALSFHERAEAFYERLILRRFNTLETFNDPLLRGHFRSEDLFFDYYADLAAHLDEAHFEKSRPTSFEVQEFVFEDSARVVVQVRFDGEDDRPLRPGSITLVRRDFWERSGESWWINPRQL